MSETWDDDDIKGLSITYEFHITKTIRGARDSLGGQAGMGPPLEPDEVVGYYEVENVSLYEVDLDMSALEVDDHYGEEEEMTEDIAEKVTKKIQELMGE